jgi:nucleoid-associated protein YgaU
MGFLESIFGKKKRAPVDFTNVTSGSSSTAPLPDPTVTHPEVAAPTPTPAVPAVAARTYVVVPGDSLSKIAKHEYGNAQAWTKIYEANRAIIKNPDLIYPGQTLTIPPA